MFRVKDLIEQSRSLGGLHHNPVAQQMEMSFPYFRMMIHQAADFDELYKAYDIFFALEVEYERQIKC